jgi:hypothetical protein
MPASTDPAAGFNFLLYKYLVSYILMRSGWLAVLPPIIPRSVERCRHRRSSRIECNRRSRIKTASRGRQNDCTSVERACSERRSGVSWSERGVIPPEIERSRPRPELLRSPAFVLIVSIWAVPSYRASFNNFCTLGLPQAAHGPGALT